MPSDTVTRASLPVAAWQSLAKAAGLDRAIGFTVLNYGISAVIGPLTAFFIARKFSLDAQGLYYAFLSVLGLQTVFELGFSQCVTQFASHEFAHLNFQDGNVVAGEALSLGRLASLARLALKWFAVLAVIMLCGVGAGGYEFLDVKAVAAINWAGPWALVCVATALNLTLIPCFSLIEGCNRVSWSTGIRCAAAFARSAMLCAGIVCGLELYALGLAVLAYFLVAGTGLLMNFRGFFRQLLSHPSPQPLSWRQEIWPFQWKIGVSWLSGYFAFQLFVPFLYRSLSPSVAGRFGMTSALVQGIAGVAIAWGSTKVPRYGILIKQKKYAELDALWLGATIKSAAIAALGGVVLLVGTWFLQQRQSHLAGHLLDVVPAALLVMATVLNQVISGEAFYLRAHKREPFLLLSVANGLSSVALIFWLGRMYSTLGVSLAYFVVTLAILPWATLIFRRCRRQWHAADAPEL